MKRTRDNGSYGHILKYTGLFGSVQLLTILIGLVRNKVVAVLLGPVGMGLTALFNSTLSFGSQATGLGLSFSAVRHLSEEFENGDTESAARYVGVVRLWSIVTAVVGTLLFALLAPLIDSAVFTWGNHTLHFVLLSPIVGMSALTGSETAILKGARQLRSLASIQVWSVVAALVVSVPVYWFFGMSGIVPVLVLCAFFTMVLTLRRSLRLFPLRFRGDVRRQLLSGLDMVKLGVSFVLAGIFGTGAELLVRSFLNVAGDLDTVGLYNAGFVITMTYAGLVFSAMETDYFPRLSAVNHDNRAVRVLANRQIEVSLLLVSPMLVALMVFLPLLMPLLYSGKFLSVVPMAQVAVLAMYFKAATSPLAYINLAKGNSRDYILLEGAYAVYFVLLVIFFYHLWGLYGTGVAISLSNLIELVTIGLFAHFKYGYTMSLPVVVNMAVQYLLGALAYVATLTLTGWGYWSVGLLLLVVSAAVSLRTISRKTELWNAIKSKFVKK